MALVSRLYLGRNIPNGGTVSDVEFNDYLSYSVDTRFPSYTVYRAEGVWNGEPEDTTILEIIEDSRFSVDCSADVRMIANIYKSRFNQESVMVTKQIVDADFL